MVQYTVITGREGFLGQGQFGVVDKVVETLSGEVFACKTIRFQDSEKHRAPAEREYSILSRLNHPNVLRYADILWEPTSAKIYMNFCAGGSLADFINSRRFTSIQQQVSADYVLSVFHQLSAALLYCHNGLTVGAGGSLSGISFDWSPVLHRDIKPGNIMLSTRDETDEVVVKLGDFGLSTFLEDDQAPSTYAGTKEYLAPEINRYKESNIYWTKACDIFSAGCTMYELASLKPPFFGHMDDDDLIESLPDHVPPKTASRIMACISYQPERRPDAFDLLRSTKWHKAGLVPLPTPTPGLTLSASDTSSAPLEISRKSRSSAGTGSRDPTLASAVGTHSPSRKRLTQNKTSRYKPIHPLIDFLVEFVQIEVKTLSGMTIDLEVEDTRLVSYIMEEIQKAKGIPLAKQCLFRERGELQPGEELQPGRTIASYNILSGSSLMLFLK